MLYLSTVSRKKSKKFNIVCTRIRLIIKMSIVSDSVPDVLFYRCICVLYVISKSR